MKVRLGQAEIVSTQRKLLTQPLTFLAGGLKIPIQFPVFAARDLDQGGEFVSFRSQESKGVIDNGHRPGIHLGRDREYLTALLTLDWVANARPPNAQGRLAARRNDEHAGA